MKIEVTKSVGDVERLVRVSIGDRTEVLTLGEFSRLIATPTWVPTQDVQVPLRESRQ